MRLFSLFILLCLISFASDVEAGIAGRGNILHLIVELEKMLGKELVLPTVFDSEREVAEFRVTAESVEVEIELVLQEMGLAVQSKDDDRWILREL